MHISFRPMFAIAATTVGQPSPFFQPCLCKTYRPSIETVLQLDHSSRAFPSRNNKHMFWSLGSQNGFWQIYVIFRAQRQKCDMSAIRNTGSIRNPFFKLTCAGSTENKTNSLLVHSSDLVCTKLMSN